MEVAVRSAHGWETSVVPITSDALAQAAHRFDAQATEMNGVARTAVFDASTMRASHVTLQLPDGSTGSLERIEGAGGHKTIIRIASPSGRSMVATLVWARGEGGESLQGQTIQMFQSGLEIARLTSGLSAGEIDPAGSALAAVGDGETGGPERTTAAGACAAEIQAAQDAINYYWSVCVAAGISALGGPVAFAAGGAALIYAAYMVDVTQERLDECMANI